MKQKSLQKMVWLIVAMLTSLTVNASKHFTHDLYYTVNLGETKSISTSIVSPDNAEGGFNSYDGDKIVVISSSLYSATILGINPGSTNLYHYYQTVTRENGLEWHHTTFHITVNSSSLPKLVITPNTNRTKVIKGTVLKLTPNISGSTIYYSTTGSVKPGYSSTFPSSGLTINSKTTVRAQAVKSGYPLSDVFERSYEVVEGDFQTKVAGGNTLYFKIISEAEKTCQVFYVPEDVTGTLRIPKQINGYTVTEIAEQAAVDCKDMTAVILPETLVNIKAGAFEGCTQLTDISFPDNLIRIGDRAFYGCTGLTALSLSASISVFGKSVFEGCTSLKDITLADGLSVIGERAFAGCTSLKNIVFSNTLHQINKEAFVGCVGLNDLNIPGTITNFGTSIFKDCTGLQTVTIEEGVTEIAAQTFLGCTSLSTTSLPMSLQIIGKSAFEDCTCFTDLNLPDGVSEIGSAAFKGCLGVMTVSLPSGLKTIKNEAFFGCVNLPTITIPETVAEIGSKAFGNCPVMKTIYSYIENPFVISDDVFTSYDETVTLYVPKGTSDLYWSVSGWIQFFNIIDDLIPTNIENHRINRNTSYSVYSLSGQRLQNPVKGINIIDGKKFVIK